MYHELKRGRIYLLTYEELCDDYVMYSFPEFTVKECVPHGFNFRSDPYVSNRLIFTVMDLLDYQNILGQKDRIAIYVSLDLCMIVKVKDYNHRIDDLFGNAIQHYEQSGRKLTEVLPEQFLYRFLEELILNDRKFLENMEFNMSELEGRMSTQYNKEHLIREVISFKKELMYIRNYYEQLLDYGEVLRDNENGSFPEESGKRFEYWMAKISRLSDTVKYLKEYTVQLRENYDAMMDYSLNNVMKLFTVITTIFMPLTLIAGWYGMNFEYMPELHWKYGYLAVIILSAVIIMACIGLFKKLKLL